MLVNKDFFNGRKTREKKRTVQDSRNITIMDQEQLKNLSPQQKDELMRNVQAQVALANMQELLTVSSKVFWVDKNIFYIF